MSGESIRTKSEIVTTTISFGDGRFIVIDKTMVTRYEQVSGTNQPVHVGEAGTTIRYTGFTTESMAEFNDLYARRREPGAIDEIEKFIERHRVYRANVIGDES
jgi:hypothetical protein